MIPGALLVPIGFFWYGWSIQGRAHWIMPNIGAVLFGAGIIISMQCVTSYIIDAYSVYAASAIAATTVLRALAGFGQSPLGFCLLWVGLMLICLIRVSVVRAIYVQCAAARLVRLHPCFRGDYCGLSDPWSLVEVRRVASSPISICAPRQRLARRIADNSHTDSVSLGHPA